MERLYKTDFKAYVHNLRFDEDLVKRLKIRYDAIA